MLEIKYEYFCKNPDALFSEMRNREECGMVDMDGEGYFLVKYQSAIAANDPNIQVGGKIEPTQD